MSEHKVSIRWQLTTPDFHYDRYNREHDVVFHGGTSARWSSAPEYKGDASCPNPEEALVAALSSCHMLTFLAVAAKRGHVVEAYEDHATGVLEKNAKGKLAVTRVVLRPRIAFRGDGPNAETLVRMHESSHRECFIANSVLTEITIEPA